MLKGLCCEKRLTLGSDVHKKECGDVLFVDVNLKDELDVNERRRKGKEERKRLNKKREMCSLLI